MSSKAHQNQYERLFLTSAEASRLWLLAGWEEHHGVTCDVCETKPIVGLCYKSQVLDDFDVCGGCINSPGADVGRPYATVQAYADCNPEADFDADYEGAPAGVCHIGEGRQGGAVASLSGVQGNA
jgi:hypothetical protein